MQLTLVRHAIADDGTDDATRALTKEGRKKFASEVVGLEALGLRFSTVFHSPKRRAVQTAELLAPLCDGELVETPLLAHAPDLELLRVLEVHEAAAVGHEPHLSALLAWLVLGDVHAGEKFELKKGAVARLEGDLEPGGMRLLGLFSPRSLRR